MQDCMPAFFAVYLCEGDHGAKFLKSIITRKQ